MKKLTIEEKAKAYDGALKIATDLEQSKKTVDIVNEQTHNCPHIVSNFGGYWMRKNIGMMNLVNFIRTNSI